MAITYKAIASTTLTTTSSAVTFSSIPATYTDLMLVVSARTDRAGGTYNDSMRGTFNSDTTNANYIGTNLYANAGTMYSYNITAREIGYALLPSSGSTANFFGVCYLYFPNYTATSAKSVFVHGSQVNISTTNYHLGTQGFRWSGTSAISTIEISTSTGSSYVANSCFDLYGILKA